MSDPIPRYTVSWFLEKVIPDPAGVYVRYADHLEEMAEVTAQRDQERAACTRLREALEQIKAAHREMSSFYTLDALIEDALKESAAPASAGAPTP